MAATPKIPWPETYLGRLQAVMEELQSIGQPASVEMLVERFNGVTLEQVEGTLAALVLFGRIDKKGDHFSIAKDG
ncbi:MAG TPA: hypothetical protein VK961_25925 [Chthoniobacter sp.]|nr:hypothetical protein [Chthoniobacter sp.]